MTAADTRWIAGAAQSVNAHQNERAQWSYNTSDLGPVWIAIHLTRHRTNRTCFYSFYYYYLIFLFFFFLKTGSRVRDWSLTYKLDVERWWGIPATVDTGLFLVRWLSEYRSFFSAGPTAHCAGPEPPTQRRLRRPVVAFCGPAVGNKSLFPYCDCKTRPTKKERKKEREREREGGEEEKNV